MHDAHDTYLDAVRRASDDAIFGVDLDGAVTDWNRGAERISGRRADVVVGTDGVTLVSDSFRDAWCSVLSRAFSGEAVYRAPIEFRRNDGAIVPVAVSTSPLRRDGGVVGAVVVARDLSEQHIALLTLEATAERMAENEALAQTGTWVWDSEVDSMQWSAEMHRLHGVAPADFGGDWQAHSNAIHPADRDRVRGAFAKAVRDVEGFDGDYRVRLPLGDIHWVHVRGEPLRGEDDEFVGMRGICQDVTVRREAENAIRSALERERNAAEELRKADRLKDEFLAIVSHELRTPLTAIAGFAALLSANPDVPEQLLGPVMRNAREMEGMVERLLDFTRLEANRVDPVPRHSPLANEVEQCISRLEPLLFEHDVRIDMPEGIAVLADRELLGHVFANLIGNAVKYAPPATPIVVSARREADAVVVSVADQGRGVPPELQERVFERFIQGPDQPNGKRGTGIGLSVVSRCISLMGGEVWCADGPDGGAVFSFTLPVG